MNRAFLLGIALTSLLAGCSGGSRRASPGDAMVGFDTGTDGGGTCPTGQADCDGGCVDLQYDPANCGGCGVACGSDEWCIDGACTAECTGSRPTQCGADCVDTATNAAHCGGCDMACGASGFCMGGECMVSCGEFADLCMGECIDYRTDVDNCGSCGNACPSPPNASGTCDEGACGFVCDAGWEDCNGVIEDGCEVAVADDPDNCGACDNVCPTPDHAMRTCEASACGFVCDMGWEDCNMDPADGCEADLTSPATCGSCDNVCMAGETCVDGMCSADNLCYGGTARILVYGPGGTQGTMQMAAGTATITVATDAMWRTMTTADFGQYDIVWFDGNDCAGTADEVFGTAEDTIAAWGPAIRGRSLIMIGDPDHHVSPEAATFYTNAANWLKENGRNVDGGRTSLFFNWGCTVYNSNSMMMVPGRGTPEQFTSVLGSPITTDTMNYCAATTAPAGTSHPVLAGLTSYWSCPLHGGFTTYPPAFDVITYAGTSGNGILVSDPTPCMAAP